MTPAADAIIVGAGLAGLVAACELADAGKTVIVVDQEPEQSLGGQAFWSFGGLFLVDSPEQRRMRIRDSRDLAWSDWLGTAAFDRPEDHWPRKWAQAYVDFAAGEKRSWLAARGLKFFPVVGWAERGGGNGSGHGNSVPRFHIVWGTGPGVLEPFVLRAREAEKAGLLAFRFRHRVDEIVITNGAAAGVRGAVLEADAAERGRKSSRVMTGDFELKAPIVIGRDHLDSGSVASPNRETEAMMDGSDAVSDWPLLNALLNCASGATWVSLHHGGGVGMGFSQHAGMVIVADGTEAAAARLGRVLWNDPATGVMRHADAGYEIARDWAKEKGLDLPGILG